jgi:hypothetical protein
MVSIGAILSRPRAGSDRAGSIPLIQIKPGIPLHAPLIDRTTSGFENQRRK